MAIVFINNLTGLLLLLLSTELLPLSVSAKDPVPPAKSARIVTVKIVVMKIMKSSTYSNYYCILM